MDIPIGFIEGITMNLPPVNEYNGGYIREDFVYNGQEFSLYFYKVKDIGDYFWICNPTHVHDRV